MFTRIKLMRCFRMRKHIILALLPALFSICLPNAFPMNRENSLVTGLGGDPKTFNQLLAQETSSTQITQFLFEGLTRLDPISGKIEPNLAKRWKTTDDGLTWTFELREDVRWSDGTPFSAGDVYFTFNDVIFNPDLNIPVRDIFTFEGQAMTVRVIDEYKVEFRLPAVFAPFLLAMGQAILPKHKLDSAVKDGNFNSVWSTNAPPSSIVGTGPYRLSAYQPGEKIILEKNPYYWKKNASGERMPYIDHIVMLILPNGDTRLLKFIQGELDNYTVVGRDFPILKKMASSRDFSLFRTGPGFGSNFLVFNQSVIDPLKSKLFRQLAFRRAVAHALDRSSMIDLIYNGLGEIQCSPVSPSNPIYYLPDAVCYDYDLSQAKELLKQGGYEDRDGDGYVENAEGQLIEFVMMTNADNPERVKLAQMMREDLERLGLKVSLLTLEFNTMIVKLLTTKDWDAVLLGLTGSTDPHFGANVWRSDGSLHFWESKELAAQSEVQQEIDALFNHASQIFSTRKRKEAYAKWQFLVAENLPHIYTVLPEIIYAVNNRIEGVRPSALGGIFHNIEELKIKE